MGIGAHVQGGKWTKQYPLGITDVPEWNYTVSSREVVERTSP